MTNIELPKDAEGREVPLDTRVLYNDRGVEYKVNRFTFGFDVITHEVKWTAQSYGTGDMVYRLPVNSMHLERPDSLWQLAEDLNRAWNVHGKGYRDMPCHFILVRELRTAYGKPITGINGYVLSCGHPAVGFEKPRYCPKCGEEVSE